LQLLGSQFACLMLFQSAKYQTQRNHRAKDVSFKPEPWPENLGRLYICTGGLNTLKIWWNLHWFIVLRNGGSRGCSLGQLPPPKCLWRPV